MYCIYQVENAYSLMALVHTSNFLEVRVCSAHVMYISFWLLILNTVCPFISITYGKTWIFSNASRWSFTNNLNIFFIGYSNNWFPQSYNSRTLYCPSVPSVSYWRRRFKFFCLFIMCRKIEWWLYILRTFDPRHN